MKEMEKTIQLLSEERDKKNAELEQITKVIEEENHARLEIERNLKQKEAELNHKENAAFEIRRECEMKLSEESMAVNLAKEELRALDQKDISNLPKLVKNPNIGIKLTLEMLSMLTEKKRRDK